MIRALLLLFLLALPALAQKNAYEAKVVNDGLGSQGNGGATQTGAFLIQPIEADCTRCVHGRLHVMDFGGGPFLIDDEGYISPYVGVGRGGVLSWTSAREPGGDLGVRTFTNGVR